MDSSLRVVELETVPLSDNRTRLISCNSFENSLPIDTDLIKIEDSELTENSYNFFTRQQSITAEVEIKSENEEEEMSVVSSTNCQDASTNDKLEEKCDDDRTLEPPTKNGDERLITSANAGKVLVQPPIRETDEKPIHSVARGECPLQPLEKSIGEEAKNCVVSVESPMKKMRTEEAPVKPPIKNIGENTINIVAGLQSSVKPRMKNIGEEAINTMVSGESPRRLYVVRNVIFQNRKSVKSSIKKNTVSPKVKKLHRKVIKRQEKVPNNMRKCNNCGYLISIYQNSKNCRKCGAKTFEFQNMVGKKLKTIKHDLANDSHASSSSDKNSLTKPVVSDNDTPKHSDSTESNQSSKITTNGKQNSSKPNNKDRKFVEHNKLPASDKSHSTSTNHSIVNKTVNSSKNVKNDSYMSTYLQFVENHHITDKPFSKNCVLDHHSEEKSFSKDRALVPVLTRLPQEVVSKYLEKSKNEKVVNCGFSKTSNRSNKNFQKIEAKPYLAKSDRASLRQNMKSEIIIPIKKLEEDTNPKGTLNKIVELKKIYSKNVDKESHKIHRAHKEKSLRSKTVKRNIRLQQAVQKTKAFSGVKEGGVKKFRRCKTLISKKKVDSMVSRLETGDVKKLTLNKTSKHDIESPKLNINDCFLGKKAKVGEKFQKTASNTNLINNKIVASDGTTKKASRILNKVEKKPLGRSEHSNKYTKPVKTEEDSKGFTKTVENEKREFSFCEIDKKNSIKHKKSGAAITKDTKKRLRLKKKPLLNKVKSNIAVSIAKPTINDSPRNLRSSFGKEPLKTITKKRMSPKKQPNFKSKQKISSSLAKVKKRFSDVNKNIKMVEKFDFSKQIDTSDENLLKPPKEIEIITNRNDISDNNEFDRSKTNTKESKTTDSTKQKLQTRKNSKLKNQCYYCKFEAENRIALIKHILRDCRNFKHSDLITCKDCDLIDKIKKNCKNCASICGVMGCIFTTWFKNVMNSHKKKGLHKFGCKNCHFKTRDPLCIQEHWCNKKSTKNIYEVGSEYKCEYLNYSQVSDEDDQKFYAQASAVKKPDIQNYNSILNSVADEQTRNLICDRVEENQSAKNQDKTVALLDDQQNNIIYMLDNPNKFDNLPTPYLKSLRRCENCNFISKKVKVLTKCRKCNFLHDHRLKLKEMFESKKKDQDGLALQGKASNTGVIKTTADNVDSSLESIPTLENSGNNIEKRKKQDGLALQSKVSNTEVIKTTADNEDSSLESIRTLENSGNNIEVVFEDEENDKSQGSMKNDSLLLTTLEDEYIDSNFNGDEKTIDN